MFDVAFCAIGKHGQFGLNGRMPWEEISGERSAHWNLGLQERNLTLSVPSARASVPSHK